MSDNDLLKPQPRPTFDENKDYLGDLVGEGKQYKDHAALAKAAAFKQHHIERLEAENALAREELSKRVSLDEVMQRMETLSQARPVPDNRPPQVEPSQQAPAAAIDPTKIDDIVSTKLSELRENERRTANVDAVRNELAKRFGPSFDNAVKTRLSELGIGEKFANDLARNEPKAFLALFPERQVAPADQALRQVAPPESIFTPAPASAPTGKKFKDYQALYRKDPAKFLSPQIQLEIEREAQRQGQSFYD
jgi:hypothetical protein